MNTTLSYLVAMAGIAVALGAAVPALADTQAPTNAPPGMHGRMSGQWGRGPMMKPAVTGTVSSISGNKIMLEGREGFGTSTPASAFTIDASNAHIMKNNATSSISAIASGDMLLVEGTVSGSNVAATMIRDGQMPMRGSGQKPSGGQMPAIEGNGEPVVAGTVSSIDGSTLTVKNNGSASYSIDAANAKIMQGNKTIALADIKSGDHVLVQGTVNGTSVTASTIMDEAAPAATGSDSKKGGGGFFGHIGQFLMHLFGF